MLFNDFNIKPYLAEKPPNDNSFHTFQEIKNISKIPVNKKFVEEKDDIKKSFENIVGEDKDIDMLISTSHPKILEIKNYHNRPRPKNLAKKIGINMDDIEMESMQTPSYPSGHSTQAYLLGYFLS